MDSKQDKEIDKTIEAADTNQEALNDEVEELITDKKKPEAVAGDNAEPVLPKSRKPKKKKKWIKWIVIAAIVGAVVFFFVIRSGQSVYPEETVTKRDIVTYHSFTGTIKPVTEQNVLPDVVGVKISKFDVEEGDEVKKGDVIAELDQKSIQDQIDQLKATMGASQTSGDISVRQANKTYSDYKNDIDNGTNQSILSATQAIDTAFASLVAAQQAYNQEVNLNNKQLSSTIQTSMNAIDTAYQGVRSAELTASYKYSELDKTKSRSDGSTASKDAVDTSQYGADSAGLSLDSAWLSYNQAVSSYNGAKINEENSLTQKYDSLVQAEIAYLNSLDSYNAALQSVDQQLSTYALSIESAHAATNQDANTVKLEQLEEQIDDCTVRAPMDGTVTVISLKEGDVTTSAGSLATVTSFDKMQVSIKIGEYDIKGVEKGTPVSITVDALDKTYDGSISKISRVATVDNGVSYFTSDVEFDADEDVRSGMSVEAKITVEDKKQVLTLPVSLILTNDDGTTYVNAAGGPKGTTPTKTAVEVGASDGMYTEITSGLKGGDKVLDTSFGVSGTQAAVTVG